MLREIKDFARCSVRNRYVLAHDIIGGLGLTLAGGGIYNQDFNIFIWGGWMTAIGLSLAVMSQGGYETYKMYTRTRDHLERHGRLDQRCAEILNSDYCTRTGVRMAAEDAGLDSSVLDAGFDYMDNHFDIH